MDSLLRRRTLLNGAAVAGGALLVGGLSSCSGEPDMIRADVTRQPATEPDPDLAAAVSALTGRGLDWGGTTVNLVCSPFSLYVVLAMLRNGAGGATAEALDAVLGVPLAELNAGMNTLLQGLAARSGRRERTSGARAEVELQLAQQLWAQQGLPFRRPFLETLARWFGAGMAETDLSRPEAAAREINAWISKQTDGALDEVVDPGLLADSVLVLANAIHLKAPWDESFTRSEPDEAFQSPGGARSVPMMATMTDTVAVRTELWTACQVPYAGSELAMLVLLPAPGRESEVAADLADGGLHRALTSTERASVDLSMPLFAFQTQLELAEPLVELGLERLFDRADLSGMSERGLEVKRARQAARIAVDEEGTEASAATVVSVGPVSASPDVRRVELVCDRPFVFVVNDRATATPLFAGWVRDPS